MGNALAPLAILAWIPVTLVLFARLRPAVACSLALIVPSILLPVGFGWNFVGLPSLHRESIAVLAAVVGTAVFARGWATNQRAIIGIEWLAVAMVVGGFLTAMSNGDVVLAGERVFPAMTMRSGVSRMAGTLLQFWAPFYLGRILFRRPEELRYLLMVLAALGLGYAFPVLWEARMSPQLHHLVYGYLPADWLMSIRHTGWGWRPMVFVGHGLALSVFMVCCALAATALWRARLRLGGFSLVMAPPFLFAIVLACQSLAALVYAACTVPVLAFARASLQRWLVLALASLVLSYPALRALDLFPTDTLVSLSSYEGGRERSLALRFNMEDLLLEKARQRMWFGWGGYGRERRYDLGELAIDVGKTRTISDGYWIIVFGQRGAVGFVCAFGMLLLPAVFAGLAVGRRRPSRDTYLVLGTAWICVVGAIDLLPNGFLTVRHVFMAGALYGATRGWGEQGSSEPPTAPGAASGSGSESEPEAASTDRQREASLAGGLLRGDRRAQPRGRVTDV